MDDINFWHDSRVIISSDKILSNFFLLVPPDILNSGTSDGEVSVLEGENATLSCKASGRPPPRVFWRREKSDFILVRGVHDPLIQGEISPWDLETRDCHTSDLCNLLINSAAPRYTERVCSEMDCFSVRKITTRINYFRPYLHRITYCIIFL